MATGIFGQDIKIDESGQALVAANGELILTAGVETGVQDVRLRLETPLGELFYDIDFGSLIHEFFLDESTQPTGCIRGRGRARMEEDPGLYSVRFHCSVSSCGPSWNHGKGFMGVHR
jgi:hypothetical protein